MGIEFTRQEASILYGLLVEDTSDIILKIDRCGFIRHASPAVEKLGFPLPEMLIGPHLLDLVDESFKSAVRDAHADAANGRGPGPWIEFSSAKVGGPARWFAIRMHCLASDDGECDVILGVMRNIHETKALREKLFAAELTDPLTGLTNRRAFIAMLQYLVDARASGWISLFDIDYFRAINMRYGWTVGDRVLVAFARFLTEVANKDCIISRVSAQRFGVLITEGTQSRTRMFCEEIVTTLARLGDATDPSHLPITASAGVAVIGKDIDLTMRSAELALFAAKAKGRNCVEFATC